GVRGVDRFGEEAGDPPAPTGSGDHQDRRRPGTDRKGRLQRFGEKRVHAREKFRTSSGLGGDEQALETPVEVGGPGEAQLLERKGGEARGVALVADQDDRLIRARDLVDAAPDVSVGGAHRAPPDSGAPSTASVRSGARKASRRSS